MAETKSSRSLSGAADAEKDALKEGRTGGRSGRDVDHDEDIKPESFTYNPDPGDPEETVAFGMRVKKGEAVEFSDPRAIRKLRNNPAFMDDGAKEKMRKAQSEARGADFEAQQRAVATEQDLIEAMGDPDKDVDTRLPEVPQAASLAQQKQRKLVEQLLLRDNPRPPEEGGETTPASRRRKADE